MGIMNQSQAMQFIKGDTANMKAVPENCIILNDETLECKDSLTNSYLFTTQVRILYLRNIHLHGGINGTLTLIRHRYVLI